MRRPRLIDFTDLLLDADAIAIIACVACLVAHMSLSWIHTLFLWLAH
jgi:hypothetical protein